MTAECGVIYRAGEALCGRKSILQHRVNPKLLGNGSVSVSVRCSGSGSAAMPSADGCLEYETRANGFQIQSGRCVV